MDKDQLTELIIRAKNGNHGDLEVLFSLYCDPVYFLALKNVRNHEDALDIVQETFAAVFQNIRMLQNPNAFKSWLCQITINKCKCFWKSKKDMLLPSDEINIFEEDANADKDFVPQDVLDITETRNMIMSLIDSLPDEQRTSVMLYYYEELKLDEIAEIMECPVNTVKSRLFYARKQIKEGVESYAKKGDKLYNIGTLPVLTLLLKDEAKKTLVQKEISFQIFTNALKVPGISGLTVLNRIIELINYTTYEKVINELISLPLKTKLIAGAVTAAVAVTSTVVTIAVTNEIYISRNNSASTSPIKIKDNSGVLSSNIENGKQLSKNKISLKPVKYAIVDDKDPEIPAYADIIGGSFDLSKLSQFVFTLKMRDLPKTLQFDKSDVPADYPEYKWQMFFIMDNGVRYEISTSYYRHSGRTQTEAAIDKYTQTNIWENGKSIKDVRLSLNNTEDSLEISGEMPPEFDLNMVSVVYISALSNFGKEISFSDEAVFQEVDNEQKSDASALQVKEIGATAVLK